MEHAIFQGSDRSSSLKHLVKQMTLIVASLLPVFHPSTRESSFDCRSGSQELQVFQLPVQHEETFPLLFRTLSIAHYTRFYTLQPLPRLQEKRRQALHDGILDHVYPIRQS